MSWDTVWKEKKYITDFSLRWLEFLSSKAADLTEDARILEAGCGSGEGVGILAGRVKTAVGLDISQEAVTKTASFKNVLVLRGDNFMLPFADNTFDLVFNSGVIEHFKYPDNVRQVREMTRVTRPGGQVIINVPNSLCLWYIFAKGVLIMLRKWKFGYEESYTPRRLEATVRQAGLKPVGFTGFLCLPPLATIDVEILPLGIRKSLASIEKYLPFKQYYCYSVCALCSKD